MRSVGELEIIRKDIDRMSKFHHVEILKLLKQHQVVLNENNYGTFVNMSELDGSIVDRIVHYIEYTDEQEVQLNNIEYEKGQLKFKFFNQNANTIEENVSEQI
jgi:hypothetical protein